jgi:hypothetical protein
MEGEKCEKRKSLIENFNGAVMSMSVTVVGLSAYFILHFELVCFLLDFFSSWLIQIDIFMIFDIVFFNN